MPAGSFSRAGAVFSLRRLALFWEAPDYDAARSICDEKGWPRPSVQSFGNADTGSLKLIERPTSTNG